MSKQRQRLLYEIFLKPQTMQLKSYFKKINRKSLFEGHLLPKTKLMTLFSSSLAFKLSLLQTYSERNRQKHAGGQRSRRCFC